MQTDHLKIDTPFVSRLLLGALSEQEQRMLAARLLSQDPDFRMEIVSILDPFEMFDLDLVAEYSAVLQREAVRRREAVTQDRRTILKRAFARASDLDALIRGFTFDDVLSLGEVSRQLFSWSMAEYLLLRAQHTEMSSFNKRTSLYLATMVIDVVDILGRSGHSLYFPDVIDDVRRRIHEASTQFQEAWDNERLAEETDL